MYYKHFILCHYRYCLTSEFVYVCPIITVSAVHPFISCESDLIGGQWHRNNVKCESRQISPHSAHTFKEPAIEYECFKLKASQLTQRFQSLNSSTKIMNIRMRSLDARSVKEKSYSQKMCLLHIFIRFAVLLVVVLCLPWGAGEGLGQTVCICMKCALTLDFLKNICYSCRQVEEEKQMQNQT